MRALGFDVNKAEVLKILRELDRDGSSDWSGKFIFADFVLVSK